MRIAVIGAGLAGLTAARELAGHEVVVFEKSRGPGGRTATRRGPDGMRFDHGAPALHDRGAPLTGLPALATHAGETVGDGANNAPAKALAKGLDVRAGVRVAPLAAGGYAPAAAGRGGTGPDAPGAAERAAGGHALTDEHGAPLGTFDAVLVTAPAPQSAELLEHAAPALARAAARVAFAPCWTVMATYAAPFTPPDDPRLASARAEAPKPGRAPGERWVLHARADWSRAHLEDEPGAVLAALLPGEPTWATAHRWRFARPEAPLTDLFLQAGTILAAGDWCGGDDAGAAVRSGRAAARAITA